MDFTKLPLHTRMGEGEILICPYCGRRGLAEKREGKMCYTHLETIDGSKSDQPQVNVEWCPGFPKNTAG